VYVRLVEVKDLLTHTLSGSTVSVALSLRCVCFVIMSDSRTSRIMALGWCV